MIVRKVTGSTGSYQHKIRISLSTTKPELVMGREQPEVSKKKLIRTNTMPNHLWVKLNKELLILSLSLMTEKVKKDIYDK